MVSAPPGIDLSQDRSGYIRSGLLSCLVLAIVSTILRVISRIWQKIPFGAADWFITAALCTSIVQAVFVLLGISYGFGKHVEALTPANLEAFLKIFFAGELSYITTITLVKISILIFYCVIFPSRNFKIAATIIGAVVIAWAIGCVLGTIFSCIPVSAFWDLALKPNATCIDSTVFFIGNAIPNIITDTTILLLPLSKIWKLQMTWQKKTAVSAMFLLGSFVIVTSILRLALLFHEDSNDPTWGLVNAVTWSAIEVNVAILSANLPTLRPLFNRIWPSNSASKYGELAARSDTNLFNARSREKTAMENRAYAMDGCQAENGSIGAISSEQRFSKMNAAHTEDEIHRV